MIDSVRYGWSMAIGLVLIFVGLIQIALEHHVKNKRIKSLGGRAPTVVAGWIPFGVDFMWSIAQSAMQHNDFSFWSKNFAKWGAPKRPWTFEAPAFGTRVIYTADKDNFKAVFSSQFNDFKKGDGFREKFRDFLGHSVFTTDGEQWRHYRKLIRPQFEKHRISDLDILEKHVQILFPLLEASQAVNVVDLFLRLGLDTFTESFFGKSVASLQTPDDDLAQAFSEVQRLQNLFNIAGPLKIFLCKQSFYKGIRRLDDFISPIITSTINDQNSNQGIPKRDKSATFLHTLSNFTLDQQVLRDQLVSVLMAGRDSTGYTMSWMFYNLARQPCIVQRLRQEILDRIGQQRPTYHDLKSLRFLQHSINETLRLYPPLPFNVRMSAQDTTLPRGGGPDGLSPVGVPKDTLISLSTLLLHRKADNYPLASPTFPDHKQFAPERWESWTPDSWAYLPFSGGPRACIGQEFATVHIAYVTVRILQRYAVIDCAMVGHPGEKCEIVLMPSKDIELAFRNN